MLLTERTIFSSSLLSIRIAAARPSAAAISDLAHAQDNLVLLPFAGIFARHDSPSRHVVANPNHALFLARGQAYRMSFPGNRGDDCLVLCFADDKLPVLLEEIAGTDTLASPQLDTHCLLPAKAMIERELLQRRVAAERIDALAVEELALSLLAASAKAASKDGRRAAAPAARAATAARRKAAVEDVKELLSLRPDVGWTLAELASAVALSPFHLARVFREQVGVPVHQYVVRNRIAKALEAMRHGETDLSRLAQDHGFAHHSHFTSTFRAAFGMTPSQFLRISGSPRQPSKRARS